MTAVGGFRQDPGPMMPKEIPNESTTQIRVGLVFVRSVRPVDSVSGIEPSREAELVFERFTDRARRVLVLAQEEARLLNHSFIGTEHILSGPHPRG
jgi:hypothetical protein